MPFIEAHDLDILSGSKPFCSFNNQLGADLKKPGIVGCFGANGISILFPRNDLYGNRLCLIGDLVFRSAPQRVARMLLNLATEEGRVTKRGVVFEPSLSRQEMAEATGISREALSRALSRLAQEGILDLDGKTITILKPAELRSRT